MRLLLDTQAFLWHANGDARMSVTATALLVDPANELFLSTATLWEIAIKIVRATNEHRPLENEACGKTW